MISPELEIYEFLDDKGFPYEDFYEPQRIPKQKDPNFISPRPGCFGQGIVFFSLFVLVSFLKFSCLFTNFTGPGKLASRSGRLSINTESLETFSRVYEIILIVQKDSKKGKARIGKGRMPKNFQTSSRKILVIFVVHDSK